MQNILNDFFIFLVFKLRRISMGILMLCLAVFFGSTSAILVWIGLHPTQTSIEVLREETAGVAKTVRGTPEKIYLSSPSVKFSRFYNDFPVSNNVPDLTALIYAAAAVHNIVLEQVSYRLTDCTYTAPLCSYEITLPVRGNYSALRGFFSQALQELPTLSIDAISITRANANDAMVQAELRMTLHLRPE